jgi:serine/threonine protein kinase
VEAAMLGKGSFGFVFAVRHELDKQEYALKVINMKKLREERGMVDNSKMRLEVETLAKLQHGHYIARYFLAQEFPEPSVAKPVADFLVIRLELCKGGTLQSELEVFQEKEEDMPIEIVRKYLAQIAEAFSFMAEKKIVHRDFKLDNLCLSQAKGDCRLVDLGFAREYGPVEAGESNLTLQTPRGHLRYRSPENNGVEKVDHKDDMWALGLVLCEMISGKTTEDIMGEHVWAKFIPTFEDKLKTWIQSVVAIDKDLGGIAQGLLQTLPGERFSAKQVLAELEYVDQEPHHHEASAAVPCCWMAGVAASRAGPVGPGSGTRGEGDQAHVIHPLLYEQLFIILFPGTFTIVYTSCHAANST